MIAILDFFNHNSGAFQAIFSILLFAATVVYVILNSLMHREMVKQRKRAETPEISIRLEKVNTGFYDLVVENISNIPAYDVVFVKVPCLKLGSDKATTDIGFIKNGIKYLAPRQSYKTFFLNYRKIDDKLQTIEFETEYKNKEKNGRKFNQHFYINLSLFYNRLDLKKPLEK